MGRGGGPQLGEIKPANNHASGLRSESPIPGLPSEGSTAVAPELSMTT